MRQPLRGLGSIRSTTRAVDTFVFDHELEPQPAFYGAPARYG